jgi:hypothetical protein
MIRTSGTKAYIQSIVPKQDEYRQNATDAIESARTATSEAARKRFLELAKMWKEGAEYLDNNDLTKRPRN